MPAADPDRVAEEALLLLKEQAKSVVRTFARTPLGRVVEISAKEVLKANAEGRKLTDIDVAELCLRIPSILRGSDDG